MTKPEITYEDSHCGSHYVYVDGVRVGTVSVDGDTWTADKWTRGQGATFDGALVINAKTRDLATRALLVLLGVSA